MRLSPPAAVAFAVVILSAGCTAEEGAGGAAAAYVDGLVACEACGLVVESLDTLQTESDLGIVPQIPARLESTDDARVAGTFSLAGEPLWFSETGTILGQIGRFGDGPGEFRLPLVLAPVPDSLLVFEAQGRITVVDLDGGEPRTIRGLTFQASDAASVRWPDRVAVASYGIAPGDSVRSIVLLDFSTSDPDPVMTVEAHARGDDSGSTAFRRQVATAVSGGFWAVDLLDYRLVLRDDSGSVVRQLRRSAAWAPDGTRSLSYGPSVEPPPAMIDVHQDADGRVWTLSRTTRSDWADAWARRGITELRSEQAVADGPRPEELWDTRIEVFSADLDSLLVSDSLPGVARSFMSDGRIVWYDQSPLGIPIVTMMRVRVDEGPGRGQAN